MFDKKIALDLLWYEIWMFNVTSKYFISLRGKETIEEKNVYLESFLLHTRNIVDFLEDRKYDNDIRCSDFGVNKTCVSLPLHNTINEINKWLSHITKNRIQQKKPEWQYLKIREEVNKQFESFLNHLSLSCFPSELGRNKYNFESLLNSPDREG